MTIKKMEKPFAFFLVLMTFQTSVQLSSLKQWSAYSMNNSTATGPARGKTSLVT